MAVVSPGRWSRSAKPAAERLEFESPDRFWCLVGQYVFMKTCTRCKKCKSFEEFYFQTKKNNYQSWCKACSKENKLEWISKNRDKVRWNTLWTKYRLRKEDYLRMAKAQNNKCAACKVAEIEVVDHNHMCCPGVKSCGKCVRALLCFKCNYIAGVLEKDSLILDRVREYLFSYDMAQLL